jgi:hypothetical protein
MAMKANKSVISALLGVALLAVPITAAARTHDDRHNRGPVPAYNSYRHAVAPRVNFAPRAAANDRRWRDGEGWRDGYRDNYRPVAAPNFPIAAPYNVYPNNYRPDYYPQAYNAAPAYYPQAYNSAPAYYGAPVGGGLANLVRQRDNAQILYRQAVANGNRDRAKHLLNDIIGLNKRIGGARTHDGYGAAYGTLNPYANTYSNGYGNGNSGLGTLVGPLLGNYIR